MRNNVFDELFDLVSTPELHDAIADSPDYDVLRYELARLLAENCGNARMPGGRTIFLLQEDLVRASKREEEVVRILTSKGEPSQLILQVLNLFEG